jgi:hypothetical protein
MPPKKSTGLQTVQQFDALAKNSQEAQRIAEYARTRGNFAVIETRPSLIPGQAYEATCCIVQHDPNQTQAETPVEVTWSAGPLFPIISVLHKDDPQFIVSFNYWGPVLIQAELKFRDKTSTLLYIYARIP